MPVEQREEKRLRHLDVGGLDADPPGDTPVTCGNSKTLNCFSPILRKYSIRCMSLMRFSERWVSKRDRIICSHLLKQAHNAHQLRQFTQHCNKALWIYVQKHFCAYVPAWSDWSTVSFKMRLYSLLGHPTNKHTRTRTWRTRYVTVMIADSTLRILRFDYSVKTAAHHRSEWNESNRDRITCNQTHKCITHTAGMTLTSYCKSGNTNTHTFRNRTQWRRNTLQLCLLVQIPKHAELTVVSKFYAQPLKNNWTRLMRLREQRVQIETHMFAFPERSYGVVL